jgi:predicted AlkP superfamily pyrophosphatase or phosphodiesterase
MRAFFYFVLAFIMLACGQESEKNKSFEGFQWVEPKSLQSFEPICFKLPTFPDQEFMLFFPEWFTSDQFNSVTKFQWDLGPYLAIGSWESDSYISTVTIRLKQSEHKLELHWEYEFKNITDIPLNNLAAFNCLLLNWAPLFKDLAMERTWIKDEKGREVLLKEIAKTQGEGKRTMQFYPAKEGIDINQFRLIARWEVNSPARLSGDRIKVVSKDGKWLLETIVDGPVAYFFNNWEDDHGCIHSAPLFPAIAPGESGVAKGRIVFTRCSEMPEGASAFKGDRALVIVVDGLRPDYITPKIMPNLSRIQEEGFTGQKHHAVFPTSTRINAASIATGAYPYKHGILNNLLYLPEVRKDRLMHTGKIDDLRMIEQMTAGPLVTTMSLGEILSTHGKKLFISSSGSSGAAYLLNQTLGNGGIVNRDVVLPDTLEPMVERILGPLVVESEKPRKKTVRRLVDALLKIGIDRIMADVMIAWITEPDGTVHANGIGAPLSLETLTFVDSEIARIFDGLARRGLLKSTNIMIISDHGFSTRSGEKSIASLLIEHGLKTDKSSNDVLIAKDAIYVNKRKEVTIPKIVRLLQQTAWIGPIFTRGQNPSSVEGWVPGTLSFSTIMWDHERSSDILTAGNWSHEMNEYGFKGTVFLPGVAGHNSTSPYDIRATFIASGPDIKSQTVSSVPTGNVDIVPTILSLFGICIPEVVDGRPIIEAIKEGPSPGEVMVKSEVQIAESKVSNVNYKFTLHKSYVNGTAYLDSTVTVRKFD